MNPELFSSSPCVDGVVSLRITTDTAPHLDQVWVDGFVPALAELGADAQIRAVILEGGTRYFSAGASRQALLVAGAADVGNYAGQAARALLDLPVPVLAAGAGHAIGGGLLLALWCDAVVLAEESLYGANFMALGFTPGMGAGEAVPEAFGAALGRELLYTGRLMTGREIRAACCPLSHAVHPRATVLERTRALAREFAAVPRPAVTALKQQLAGRRRVLLEQALRAEHASHLRLLEDAATQDEIALRYVTTAAPDPGGAP